MYKLFNNDQQRHRANRIEKAKRDITLLEEELVTVSKNIAQLQQDIQIARKDIKELQHAEELPKRKALLEQKLTIAKQKYLQLLEEGEGYNVGVETWVILGFMFIVGLFLITFYSSSFYNAFVKDEGLITDELHVVNLDFSGLSGGSAFLVFCGTMVFMAVSVGLDKGIKDNKILLACICFFVILGLDVAMSYTTLPDDFCTMFIINCFNLHDCFKFLYPLI